MWMSSYKKLVIKNVNMSLNNINCESIFQAFSKQNILIIGDVMVDAYLFGKVDRISPEAPVPIVAVKRRDNRLGGAANVALNVKSLGGTPYLCSVVGNDDKGMLFFELMKSNNINTEGIEVCDDRITTTKFRIIGNTAQMLRVDEETDVLLDAQTTELLFNRIKTIIDNKKIDVIIFQDYDKGVITHKLIEIVVALARSKNIKITVDPKKRNFNNYCNVDLFKPNLKELLEGVKSDISPKNIQELLSIVVPFQKKSGCKHFMITMSEKGALISTMDGERTTYHHVDAHLRNIADISGAGDTMISVASMCLANNMSAEDIVKISNVAGGIVCEYVGVVPVDKEVFYNEITRLLGSGS